MLFDFLARVERCSHGHVVFSRLGRFLNRGVGKPERLQVPAQLADIDRVGRAQSEQIAAAKIHAKILFTSKVKGRATGNDQRERQHAGEETFAEKVEVMRRESDAASRPS